MFDCGSCCNPRVPNIGNLEPEPPAPASRLSKPREEPVEDDQLDREIKKASLPVLDVDSIARKDGALSSDVDELDHLAEARAEVEPIEVRRRGMTSESKKASWPDELPPGQRRDVSVVHVYTDCSTYSTQTATRSDRHSEVSAKSYKSQLFPGEMPRMFSETTNRSIDDSDSDLDFRESITLISGDQCHLNLANKPLVHNNNRIGAKPEGWFAEIATLLQLSITCQTSGDNSGAPKGFEAPQPELFARARKACDITEYEYQGMVGYDADRPADVVSMTVVGASDAAGKSGAFFYLTADQSILAKTCSVTDWNTLLQILPDYVAHLENAQQQQMERSDGGPQLWQWAQNGLIDTLLPRFLGLYAFTGPSISPGGKAKRICFVLMANVFAGSRQIHLKYDLKGSTHGRRSSEKERKKKSPVLKDLDWVDDASPGKVKGPSRKLLLDALKRDAKFLDEKGLIDYSLLVGIHDKSKARKGTLSKTRLEKGKIVSVEEEQRVLYLGIVDILTPYRCKKRLETFCLGTMFCGRDVSCQHPTKYARRFLNFMEDVVFPPPPGSDNGPAPEEEHPPP